LGTFPNTCHQKIYQRRYLVFKTLIYNNVEYPNFIIDENGNIKNLKTGNLMTAYIGKTGYYHVNLNYNHKVKNIRLHKALAETFIDNPNNYPIVHHKDENKLNYSLENLEWTTPAKNVQYHIQYEIRNNNVYFNKRKLSAEDIKYIKENQHIYSRSELSKKFNVSKTTIINVCKGYCYKESA